MCDFHGFEQDYAGFRALFLSVNCAVMLKSPSQILTARESQAKPLLPSAWSIIGRVINGIFMAFNWGDPNYVDTSTGMILQVYI